MIKKKPKGIPCPHCSKRIYPAKLLGKMRMKNMTKDERKAFASNGGVASKRAMLAKKKVIHK